ncbi:hypothetical protein FKM82_023300 [Ascaphus truei]
MKILLPREETWCGSTGFMWRMTSTTYRQNWRRSPYIPFLFSLLFPPVPQLWAEQQGVLTPTPAPLPLFHPNPYLPTHKSTIILNRSTPNDYSPSHKEVTKRPRNK